MEFIVTSVADQWGPVVAYSPRIVSALIVVLLSYYAGKYFSTIVLLSLRRVKLRQLHKTFIRFGAIFLILFLGVVIALNILQLEQLAISLLAGGGVTAVVLGFAFREIVENFLAGLFLALSRPFDIDDFINTEGIEGEVRDIELRYTHLRTEDGRDVYVPSSQLFNRPVTNYTKDGLRRLSFTVGIDYSNDSLAATKLLAESVRGVDGVLPEPAADAYVLALAPQYVEIVVFFWVDFFNKTSPILDVKTRAMDNCRRALLEQDFIVSANTSSNVVVSQSP